MITIEEKQERKLFRDKIKEQTKYINEINREQNQKQVKRILFTIEWKKSSQWGHNPNLECEVYYHDGSFERSPIFKCSGCGYDKESTVIADAFNEYLKYKLWEKDMSDNDKNPYGVRKGSYTSSLGNNIDYVSYSGGIGMNCYNTIGKFIGGEFKRVASGKTFDVYEYIDNEWTNRGL